MLNASLLLWWLTIVAAVAAAFGLAFPGLFRDPAVTAGNARGTALVLMVVALPLLMLSIRIAARGSRRAEVTWLGALVFLLYNSVVFAFDVAFNALFLLYVAQLSLAAWATVAVALRLRSRVVDFALHERSHRRFIAGYLMAIAILWATFWLRDVVPALIGDAPPAGLAGTRMLTNPFEVMDLGFTLPLALLSGIWIWSRRPRGTIVGGALLTFLSVEGISVAVDQTFGHLADPSFSLGAVPIMIVMVTVGLVPTVLLLRGLGAPEP